MSYGTHTIHVGDALVVLPTLAEASFHTCVTSPPYFGLRDYGVDGQLGLEATPHEYLSRMVEVFREVRRVLRDDGVCWVNMGDSYANDTKWGGCSGGKNEGSEAGGYQGQRVRRGKDCDPKRGAAAPGQPLHHGASGLKPKDLMGMPWRLAFALQADGWYLRSDIIWHKPNPMPESVTDRPTKSHEYLFLLSKNERYFYDAEAIKEESETFGRQNTFGPSPKVVAQRETGGGYPATDPYAYPTRNRRTVWTIPTYAYGEAHFATFPPALVEPCIKAGTSERGCCPGCGKPWRRQTETPKVPDELRNRGNGSKMDYHTRSLGAGQALQNWRDENPSRTTGWIPGCACGYEPFPCQVLDPFNGSGTTGEVACLLGRNYVGIELNPAYAEMAERRIAAALRPNTFRDDRPAESALFGDAR